MVQDVGSLHGGFQIWDPSLGVLHPKLPHLVLMPPKLDVESLNNDEYYSLDKAAPQNANLN